MTAPDKNSINGRRVAILLADGVDADALYAVRKILEDGGADIEVVSPTLQDVKSTGNRLVKIHHDIQSVQAESFDAVFIPGGSSVEILCANDHAVAFVNEAYKRSKVIATSGEAAKIVVQATQDTANLSRNSRVIHYIEGSGKQFFRRLVTAIAE